MKKVSKILAVLSAAAMAATLCVSTAFAAEGNYSIIGTVNGNWDTDTALTDDDGDGIYEATLDVAAGSYEYKVRADEAWDEAWGAANDEGVTNAPGGGNCSLTLDADAKVKFSFDTTSDDSTTWACTATPVTEDEPTTPDTPDTPDAPVETGDASTIGFILAAMATAAGVAVVASKKVKE